MMLFSASMKLKSFDLQVFIIKVIDLFAEGFKSRKFLQSVVDFSILQVTHVIGRKDKYSESRQNLLQHESNE